LFTKQIPYHLGDGGIAGKQTKDSPLLWFPAW